VPTPTVFNAFKADVANKVHNLSSDTLKVALTNTAPSVSNSVFADITEISAGNGYTAGGSAITITSSTQTGGTYSLVLAALTFTASGGDIGPFRYGVLYNDTAASDQLIAYVDYGTNYTLGDGLDFTFNAGTWLQNA
jgi:hypothetical protein